METLNHNDDQFIKEETLNAKIQRRSFLRYAGAGAAAMGALAACSKTYQDVPAAVITPGATDVGAGDVGVLNYAYALEQLEAAFYVQAVQSSGFSALSADEKSYITDIRDHEVAHREFFKAALTAAAPTAIIPALTPDFSTIDFTTRAGILTQAKAFEDTGVSAYNGAAFYIKTPAYLVLAGKIVSVEARHAALIRDLLAPGSFASDLDSTGLDFAATPQSVVIIANSYLKTKISANQLK